MSTVHQQTLYEKVGLSLTDYTRLPHPARQRLKLQPVLTSSAAPQWVKRMLTVLKMPYQGIDAAVGELALERQFIEMARAEGTDAISLLRGLVVPAKHMVDDGRLFFIRPELSEVLFHTDLSDDVPCTLLRLPFRTCYFHFGEPLEDCPLIEPSGPRRMVGVYAQEFNTRPVEFKDEPLGEGETPRSILLTFVGEGTKDDPDDDVLRYLVLDLSEDNVSISEMLERVFAEMAKFEAMSAVAMNERYWKSYRAALYHTVRVMLYTACASVRLETHKTASELDEQIARTGPGKRAKLERKRARTYDYVEICAPTIVREVPSAGTSGGNRAVHWRRGHLRNQRHGPQNSLRKLIFVAPLLVSGTASERETHKEYRVS